MSNTGSVLDFGQFRIIVRHTNPPMIEVWDGHNIIACADTSWKALRRIASEPRRTK